MTKTNISDFERPFFFLFLLKIGIHFTECWNVSFSPNIVFPTFVQSLFTLSDIIKPIASQLHRLCKLFALLSKLHSTYQEFLIYKHYLRSVARQNDALTEFVLTVLYIYIFSLKAFLSRAQAKLSYLSGPEPVWLKRLESHCNMNVRRRRVCRTMNSKICRLTRPQNSCTVDKFPQRQPPRFSLASHNLPLQPV